MDDEIRDEKVGVMKTSAGQTTVGSANEITKGETVIREIARAS